MKKFLLAIVAIFACTAASMAQKTDISISYGGYTQMDASDCHDGWSPDHSSIAYHALMLNGRYNYYRNRIVTLYGHIGLGAVISHLMPKYGDSYNQTYFAYQFSPLGAQVDLSRSATIFGELGFGAQGLLQVGFRFNI